MLGKHVFFIVLKIHVGDFSWTCSSQLHSLIYDHWYFLLAEAASFANVVPTTVLFRRWIGSFIVLNHISLINFRFNCRLWLRQWQGRFRHNSGFHALNLRVVSYFSYVLALTLYWFNFLNWVQVVSCCKASHLLDSTSLSTLRTLHHLWVFMGNSDFRLTLVIWIDMTSLFLTVD